MLPFPDSGSAGPSIMQVFVINLARSTERRQRMQQQLDELGVPFAFFEAVDGRAGVHPLLQKYDEKKRMRRKGHPLMPGEVACYASHYALWQWCLEHDEPILVIEDDVRLNAHLTTLMPQLPALLSRYPYLRLARLFNGKRLLVDALGDKRVICKYLDKPRGTQCYALAPAAAARFLAYSERFFLPVDDFMDQEWRHGVPALGIEPPIVEHEHFSSEIEDRAKPDMSVVARIRREVFRALDGGFNLIFKLRHIMRRS